MEKLFEKYNLHYIDLMEMDEVAILNAMDTKMRMALYRIP